MKLKIQNIIFINILLLFIFNIIAQPNNINKNKNGIKVELIPFNFKDKKLSEIIDDLAIKKGINVIYPQKPAEAEEFKAQTITYEPSDKKTVTIDQAWDIATFFLELSGFSWFKKEANVWSIIATGKSSETDSIVREILPIYIGTEPAKLPQNEQHIRYIYYLTNLNVADKDATITPLTQIIKDMSSEGAAEPIFLPKSNGFILNDRANNIASIITLIAKLDKTGFREVIEIIPLYNVSADMTAKIFDTLKKAAGPEENVPPFIRTNVKTSISFFASDTQIIPDNRNNRLILMGRQTAVERIREFIHNHVDVPQESGDSILHPYDLQFLNAEQFAPILQEIATSNLKDSQANQSSAGGPERFFQGVVVKAEETKEVKVAETTTAVNIKVDGQAGGGALPSGITGSVQVGGNRIIVAALHDDWIVIRELIRELDQPGYQVILEVMIVDFTYNPSKTIQGAIRNPARLGFPNKGIDFLASHITPVNSVLGNTPTTLAMDLLQLLGTSTNPQSVTGLLNSGPSGSLLLSFNDPNTVPSSFNSDHTPNEGPGGIFALLEILTQYIDARVLSHPFLVCTNNQKATVASQVVKRARGDADPTQAGTVTIAVDNLPATIQVQMIPRLSSANRLGLQIAVDINEFIGDTLNRNTRRVETSANLNSGQILVIGGLTRITTTDVRTSTPFFGRIPIIGRFFEGITKSTITTNLGIFISPTISHPKLRKGLDLYTKDKIRKGRKGIDDDLVVGQTKDPIVRLLFDQDKYTNQGFMKEYLDQTSNAPTVRDIEKLEENERRRNFVKRHQIAVETGIQDQLKLKPPTKVQEVPA